MEIENYVKSTLLSLFIEGKTEIEAYKVIVKNHNSNSISQSIVNKWYEKFNSGDWSLNYSSKANVEEKFPDEYIINLIEENPELSIAELARIAGISYFKLRNRIAQLNSIGENVYKFKDLKKVSDEFIIDLVNNNPNLNLSELAELAGINPCSVYRRIKKINSSGEKANYIKKKSGIKPGEFPAQKITDEYLIKLVNENPNLNMRELGEIANVNASTISRRLKKINNNGLVNYHKKGISKLSDEFLIELIDNNPEFNMDELGIRSGVVVETISRRIKQLNSDGKPVNYISKKGELISKARTKITNEFLIELVNQNPELNMKELAKLSNVSISTISQRIKQINISGININYIKKTISRKSQQK
jgi:DeoR/GlpR family transcriptional regulator of sugar metabolism